MVIRHSKFIPLLYLAGDMLLLEISFGLAYFLKFGEQEYIINDYLLLLLAVNIFWLLGALILKTYSISRVEPLISIARNTVRLLFTHALFTAAFIVLLKGSYYSREHLMFTYIILSVLIVAWRIGCYYFFIFYRSRGFNYRRVIIMGFGETGKYFRDLFISNPKYGYVFMGFFDDVRKGQDVKGSIAQAGEFILANGVDEIYCSMSEVENRQINELVEFSDRHFVTVKMLPDFREISRHNIRVDHIKGYPVLTFRDFPLDQLHWRFVKRCFDIVFSLGVIIFIISWLFPIMALLIKLNSKGPVFFKQLRSGRNNNPFTCWKFRTMHVNGDSHVKQASSNDSRITSLGRFLRRRNIDELPQFFNVLLNNMSVVGPRPHMLKHTEEYSQMIDKYMVRHFIKPGITGLAQVRGYRGEILHPAMMKNRIRIDIFYIKNWSLWLDLKIIFVTMVKTIRGDKNAY
jgi:putative colanic acid biosynthesis UDP-glucose lipid carrier transferase